MKHEIFEDLFVLELANNHWGKLERGLEIIRQYGKVVRDNGVKAAMKLQFRDVDTFIHKDHLNDDDRYIKKTLATKMPWDNYRIMVEAIREEGMIPMATPFDEISVGKCVEYDLPIIKIASSCFSSAYLIDEIIKTAKPCIVSSGGQCLEDIEEIAVLFEDNGIPLAINHCISLYPSENNELWLDNIKTLIENFENNIIGFSTHEYHDWKLSIAIAYALGARTFERHVDIDMDGIAVSPYCSLPHQIDEWFKAWKAAKEMLGDDSHTFQREIQYLNKLKRGIYAKKDLKAGDRLDSENSYLSIPAIGLSEDFHIFGTKLLNDISKDSPIILRDVLP